MPNSYYDWPKSMHFIPALGIKRRLQPSKLRYFKAIEIYTEATTVDAWLWYKVRSSEVRFTRSAHL